jgi:hypothetical protein
MKFGSWKHFRSAKVCTFETTLDGSPITGELTYWNTGYFSANVNEYPGFECVILQNFGKRDVLLGYVMNELRKELPIHAHKDELRESGDEPLVLRRIGAR